MNSAIMKLKKNKKHTHKKIEVTVQEGTRTLFSAENSTSTHSLLSLKFPVTF